MTVLCGMPSATLINEATQEFGETCEASHIKRAAACEAHQKAVLKGDEKDPVIELLDQVLVKTREVVNKAMEAFQKQFEEVLMPRVPTEHLPILVSNAYNTVSEFCMMIWRMVADECIMPMRHDYLMNHRLGLCPATCPGEGAKHLHEDRAAPSSGAKGQPDSLYRLIGKYLGNSCTSDTHNASHGGTSSYAHSPTSSHRSSSQTSCLGCDASARNFRSSLRGVPLTSVSAGMATGVSLFQTSLAPPPGFQMLPASVRVTSTSSAPAAASTLKASTSGIALPISIPLPVHPGGRSDFLTDAIQAGSLADLDEEGNAMLDEDLRKMAGDVSRKQMAGSKHIHDEDVDEDEEAEDSNGSMFEDLDEPLPAPVKRYGKAKSPTKSGPINWLPAEVDIVRQNRYAVDRPEMRDYHRNYLVVVDQKTFNLNNHSKYLDIILAKPGITQDVVFTVEKERAYFTETRKVLTDLYDQGVLTCVTWVQTVPGQGGYGYRLRYGNCGSSQWPKYCQQ